MIQTESNNTSINQLVADICSRFIAFALPLFYFLVVIGFYLKTYDSAQIKITITQIGAVLLTCAWIIKIIFDGKLPFEKKDWVYVFPFVAFLLSGLSSYIHSPYKVWATEETLRRFFYMMLAIITVSEFNTHVKMQRLWKWIMLAAWVSIGYGLIQYLDSRLFFKTPTGLDPFIWRQAFMYRVFSTFGNPNFYGNFLVILTPFLISRVVSSNDKLIRPIACIATVFILSVLVDRVIIKGIDPSFSFVYSFLILVCFIVILLCLFLKVGENKSITMHLLLFSLLVLNLISTETKGAWIGFTAATGVTLFFMAEYFTSFNETNLENKKYFQNLIGLFIGFLAVVAFLIYTFILPVLKGPVELVGLIVLAIASSVGVLVSFMALVWGIKRPWNLKKILYLYCLLVMVGFGGFVLKYAAKRLTSVSFRQFTWIATWEMIRSSPILGNGVGTFKVIYPAHRRPEIIVLEGRSNTETDHAEDEYLEVWQDEGIVGIGILFWMIFFSLLLGVRLLKQYKNAALAAGKTLMQAKNPRAFELLGILGAYMGALIHWCFDVSIRFVSSGIFSGLLPGLLVAYARNAVHSDNYNVDRERSYDKWVRILLATIVTFIMFVLRLELVPQRFIENGDTTDGQITFFIILVGIIFYLVMELVERSIRKEVEKK